VGFLTRFHDDGIDAFFTKNPGPKPLLPPLAASPITLFPSPMNLPKKAHSLKDSNPLQHRMLILTFLIWEIITAKEAAAYLGFSEQHTRNLAHKLELDDLAFLIDKRQGQQQDYSFTTEVKAELIQQFVFNVVTGKNTSSKQVCEQVNEACKSQVSDRSIRLYMNKLGLSGIKDSLFEMLDDFKKNSRD
jgi:hypothetical protein